VDEDCRVPAQYAVLLSPASLAAGAHVRVLVATDDSLGKTTWDLTTVDRHGEPGPKDVIQTTSAWGGPPHFAAAELGALAAGQYRLRLLIEGRPVLCQRLHVGGARVGPAETTGVWPSTRGWTRKDENSIRPGFRCCSTLLNLLRGRDSTRHAQSG